MTLLTTRATLRVASSSSSSPSSFITSSSGGISSSSIKRRWSSHNPPLLMVTLLLCLFIVLAYQILNQQSITLSSTTMSSSTKRSNNNMDYLTTIPVITKVVVGEQKNGERGRGGEQQRPKQEQELQATWKENDKKRFQSTLSEQTRTFHPSTPKQQPIDPTSTTILTEKKSWNVTHHTLVAKAGEVFSHDKDQTLTAPIIDPTLSITELHTNKDSTEKLNDNHDDDDDDDNQRHLPTKFRLLPESKYTPHVQELLQVIEEHLLPLPINDTNHWPFDPHTFCKSAFRIYVDQPYSPPSAMECRHKNNVWCNYFLHLFSTSTTSSNTTSRKKNITNHHSRVLPYNVSFGIHFADLVKKNSTNWGNCFGSSGPDGGRFSMNNFQNAKAQMAAMTASFTSPNNVSVNASVSATNTISFDVHQHSKPWEERSTIPIFRGHPRFKVHRRWRKNPYQHCPRNNNTHVANGDFGHRAQAVWFSLHHPQLFDARVSYEEQPHPCQVYNTTNGMDRLFVLNNDEETNSVRIPPHQYYSNYQVAVVLGGIGAAFRTILHLNAGQAVILQRYTYEEWYVKYMTAWEHYIPLQQDLSDIQYIMEWVRDNPHSVQQIASNGKTFYEEWLTFQGNDQHWHELLWRLSILIHNNHTQGQEEGRFQTGSHRTIWPNPSVPYRYARNPQTGKFDEEERAITRQPYLDYDTPRGDQTNP